MCEPAAAAHPSDSTKRVCIVGAGPAGLLAAIFLLRRNRDASPPRYRVTLVDPGADYGLLDSDGLQRARSWMIGLSCHGLSAIREIPGLYEDYIRRLGIDVQHVVFGLSPSLKIHLDAKDYLADDSAFTVDRNYICAALSRYLHDKHNPNGDGSAFVAHYRTRALYVDGDGRSVVARKEAPGGVAGSSDLAVDYDVLLGCDGIRSVVRNAFLARHRDFEFDVRGTFGRSKSIHVPLPPGVEDGTFMFLNDVMPNFRSFVLPETGRKLNVALRIPDDKECPPELESDDAAAVAAYFRRHFAAFEIDADEAARQWVSRGWNTISQVRCNFYHSPGLSALLLGDAAHATSPQIGQGMNTALADAAALDSLLDRHGDDWTAVLPKFSEERVKEGRALTDLSFYTFSLSASQQRTLMLRQNVRITLNKYLPFLVAPDPMTEVGKGMKLSEAFRLMSKYGVIRRVREVNDGMMRDHFERTVGLVGDEETGMPLKKKLVFYGAVPIILAAAAAFAAKCKVKST